MWRIVIWDRHHVRRETFARALSIVDDHPRLTDDVRDLVSVESGSDIDLLVVIDPDDEFVTTWLAAGERPPVKVLGIVDIANPMAVWRAVTLRVIRVVSIDRPAPQTAELARTLLSGSRTADRLAEEFQSACTAWNGETPSVAELPIAVFNVLRGMCHELAGLQRGFAGELAERRRVEQALLESEAFYQSLVETLPLAMFRKDQQGRITFANKLMCEAMRRPASQIIGRTDYEFFPVELANKYRADDRRVMETQQDLETSEEFLTPTGERRVMHVIKTPVYDASGQLVGIQGIFSDVTVQRRAEEALEQERSRLDSLMQNLPDFIWFKDAQGHYLRVNPAMARACGLMDPQDAIGKTDAQLYDDDYARQAADDDLQVLSGGLPLVAQEERMTFRDGRMMWMSTTRLPLTDRDDRVIGTFGVARNIAQMKQAQAALHVAKEAAETASRAKSDFLANMSHEIRTPLNAVIGITELLHDSEQRPAEREYLRMVRESGEALLAIVDDVLDFSKIEAGKLRLEQTGFSLRDLVGNTMKSLALRAHRKQLELACHIARDVPDALMGDPHRLRQVLFNLAGNAVKFTEHGEIVLEVTLEDSTADGVQLHFVVRDTGIGISGEKIQAIFQPFEQADSSTTRRYGGTGLGLGIASRLINMMQGRIWVESLEGLGSHFHFTARFGLGGMSDSPAPPSPSILDGLRVLVVDDNATSRRILVEMLTTWGLEPLVASGTAEALVALQALSDQGKPCDVVLADAGMPGEDGFQLAARLRQQPNLCPSTLMMLTSGDRSDDIARCQLLGVSGYVIKPVKQSELLEALVSTNVEFESHPTPLPATRSPQRELRVLLVEDSHVNQKLAVGLLERWGHTVVVAGNGLEAVKQLRDNTFDLVLMDVQMPEMDGLEATQVIRKEEAAFRRGRVPIIAMTAHAMPGDRDRCVAAGMDGYVMKPIRADLLFRAIEETPAAPPHAEVFASPTSTVIDLSAANAAVNGDRRLLQQIMEAFLEEGPTLLSRLRSAWQEQQWPEARRLAHTLKGSFQTFGAAAAGETAQSLELSARQSAPVTDPDALGNLTRQSESVFAELRRYLNLPPNGGNMTASNYPTSNGDS
ncbi:MAG: response regulator [Planctomycetaceae bacterium]